LATCCRKRSTIHSSPSLHEVPRTLSKRFLIA
jgi:hypothetical protein